MKKNIIQTGKMQSIQFFNELNDNRRTSILKELNYFFPNDISNLIGKYDYTLTGNSYTLKNTSHDSIDYITVRPDSNGRIITGSTDNILRLWNLQTGICEIFHLPCIFISHSAVFPDSSCHLSETCGTKHRIVNGLLKSFSVNKCKLSSWHQNDAEDIVTDVNAYVHRISIIPGDTSYPFDRIVGLLIDGSGDGKLKIWNAQTGIVESTFISYNDTLSSFTVLSDGRIVAGSCNGKLFVWNARIQEFTLGNEPQNKNHDNIFSERGHYLDITCIATLLDGRIVSGSRDKTLKIWNLQTGECDAIFKDHNDEVLCVAVLPDGRIVSGSKDKTLKIWNPLTKKCNVTLTGHTDRVKCVGVLPDGRIVSGSEDKTIRIWC
jgi:WD40 repeat protein